MAKTIALLGAFDTKGAEYAFVQSRIEAAGHGTLTIDVGIDPAIGIQPNVDADEVAKAGAGDLAVLRAARDRGEAMRVMTEGAANLVPSLYAAGKFDGIIALGGSGGTAVATAAMRALPLGVPKVMVSTVAGGDVSDFVGVSDIVMVPSIVDVAGINGISREVFARAAAMVCAMAACEVEAGEDKPLIAASMFGNTTPAVEHAKGILEAAGYEVLVFHCTGTGGRTMESLIAAGRIAGVLDLTTTEWADEVTGGVLSAGPERLSAAAVHGVPAIVTPACLDMANFWAPDTIPSKYDGRTFYPHNPNVTLMRTNAKECKTIGTRMAEQLNKSTGPVTVLIPMKGLSMIDAEGESFWDPDADKALFDALKSNLRDDIEAIEMDCNVNDAAFSQACAERLLKILG